MNSMTVTIGNTKYEAKLIETTPDHIENGIVERWLLYTGGEYTGRLARWKTGQYAFISKPGEADILNLNEIKFEEDETNRRLLEQFE